MYRIVQSGRDIPLNSKILYPCFFCNGFEYHVNVSKAAKTRAYVDKLSCNADTPTASPTIAMWCSSPFTKERSVPGLEITNNFLKKARRNP